MILSFLTDRPGQTVQAQIRLLLEEQSDQSLHCLPFRLHRLDQGYRNFEIQIGPLDRWRHRRHTNMNLTIPNSHENSSFSSKSVSEIDYFSDRVQLQPVVSKRSKDNPKSLASDRCLLNTGVHQYLLWCLNPPIFSVSQESLFFIKSLLVYKFQGRQPFRTFKLNICFSNNAVLILFCINKLQDLKSKTSWKMFFS